MEPCDSKKVAQSGDHYQRGPQILDLLAAAGGHACPSGSVEGRAPNSTLQTTDGRRVSLADFRGRPVLVNFWATYCAPCRRELPLIERVAGQHPGVAVLLIDERDNPRSAARLADELRLKTTATVKATCNVTPASRTPSYSPIGARVKRPSRVSGAFGTELAAIEPMSNPTLA